MSGSMAGNSDNCFESGIYVSNYSVLGEPMYGFLSLVDAKSDKTPCYYGALNGQLRRALIGLEFWHALMVFR